MVTFRNNNGRRNNFRKNDRNFKSNGERSKFNSSFTSGDKFQRKIPGRNNHNASKLIEKYSNLAREALSSGDKILSENYFQHADHFTRVLTEQELQKKSKFSNEKNINSQVETSDQKTDKPKKHLTSFVERQIGIKLICDSLVKSYLNNEMTAAKQSEKRLENMVSSDAFKMLNSGDRRFCTAYHKMIKSLLVLEPDDSEQKTLPSVFHIGESHCLSFAHQTIYISSQLNQIQPVLITGGKAWHFANNENNQWKDSLNQQIKSHTYSDKAFISFGEIDCRKDEGILNYAIKNNKDISEVCIKTIKGYLDYMEKMLSPNYSTKYYFGVPAPTRGKELLDEWEKELSNIILFKVG